MIVQINPLGSMDLLSQLEVDRLQQTSTSEHYRLFRNCCLAVLNVGAKTDNSRDILEQFQDFDVRVIRRERGVKIELVNPPEGAFVDGELIKGIREHLFSVLRDILYVSTRYEKSPFTELTESSFITHVVFDLLRNAHTIHSQSLLDMVVCWGGHSINDQEYDYAKAVGFELGLRELNIVTGCGPGAMEAPMQGAAIGHSQQRFHHGRYVGITEPSIIAAEPPNPIVNELVIMPDIEKRLEAFVRVAHGIIIFPGGVGTAEELLYLLGILIHEDNRDQVVPVVLTGPRSSADYFTRLDEFITATLGEEARKHYRIIIDDAPAVASYLKGGMLQGKEHRRAIGDAFHFNWSLKIDPAYQQPFGPNHQNMAELNLHHQQSLSELAANLRRAFSGIVAGNVKEQGIHAIEQHGPFQIRGDEALMQRLDQLLKAFIAQGRMKLPGSVYHPCYEVITG